MKDASRKDCAGARPLPRRKFFLGAWRIRALGREGGKEGGREGEEGQPV